MQLWLKPHTFHLKIPDVTECVRSQPVTKVANKHASTHGGNYLRVEVYLMISGQILGQCASISSVVQ